MAFLYASDTVFSFDAPTCIEGTRLRCWTGVRVAVSIGSDAAGRAIHLLFKLAVCYAELNGQARPKATVHYVLMSAPLASRYRVSLHRYHANE